MPTTKELRLSWWRHKEIESELEQEYAQKTYEITNTMAKTPYRGKKRTVTAVNRKVLERFDNNFDDDEIAKNDTIGTGEAQFPVWVGGGGVEDLTIHPFGSRFSIRSVYVTGLEAIVDAGS